MLEGEEAAVYCTFQEDVSIIRYDAPNRQTLKSNSFGTTTSIKYNSQTTFSATRAFRCFSA